ncbi:aspartyl protease family protein At5g10770-like [Dendrobium catenatum]|uniref:aspartyl protease family protein At5g10770-like n=1 Tax=Dendrobium catenatum TaxID=906689 RepID=UPI00109F8C6A|nr:aspartyl protease family protein At5g10770-like [Dendrobium catenatum]
MCSSWKHQGNPSPVKLFRQDQARVDYIQRRASNATTLQNPIGDSLLAKVPTIIDYDISAYSYIVNIGLGTPTKFFSLLLDTGSELTWTQCVPCVNCYYQKNPFFDPTQSSTFTNIPCNSNYCTQLPRFDCSSTFTCLYEQIYFDYSKTNGSFVNDTLQLSNDIIYEFLFGCGHNNAGTFGHADGLLGLGRGAASIIYQTAQSYNKIFSYCLPSGPNKIGYLELGSSVLGVKYTSMLTNPELPSFYFLNLTAILVGGERIDLPPNVFSGPRTMLDTGTIFGHLPPTVYSALRSIFRKEMSYYPMAPPIFNLDTCYDFTNYTDVVVPEISLIYNGEVTTDLDFLGILYFFSKSQACLSFVSNKDDSTIVIIGNMQQRRLNVVIDVGNLQIGFGANGCT